MVQAFEDTFSSKALAEDASFDVEPLHPKGQILHTALAVAQHQYFFNTGGFGARSPEPAGVHKQSGISWSSLRNGLSMRFQ